LIFKPQPIRIASFELHHLGQCLFQFFSGFGIRIEQQIQVIFNPLLALHCNRAVFVDLYSLQSDLARAQEWAASADHRPRWINSASFSLFIIKSAWLARLEGADIRLAGVRNGILFRGFFHRDTKMARQPSNVLRINIDRISYLTAYSASLALKVQLNLNSQIIIGIKRHIITQLHLTAVFPIGMKINKYICSSRTNLSLTRKRQLIDGALFRLLIASGYRARAHSSSLSAQRIHGLVFGVRNSAWMIAAFSNPAASSSWLSRRRNIDRFRPCLCMKTDLLRRYQFPGKQ